MDDILLEPLVAYKTKYREEFAQNATAMFDALVEKSGVDVAENRATVNALRRELAEKERYQKEARKFSSLRVFLIILTVISAIVAVVGIALIVMNVIMEGAVCLSVGSVAALALILIITLVLNKKISAISAVANSHASTADELTDKAFKQMEPLNSAFDSGAASALVQKTVPSIHLDDLFTMRRFDYLSGKYGFTASLDNDRSTVSLLSGDVLDNPFLVLRQKRCAIGSKTYTGSIIISWTTTYTDSDGHVHTNVHTQTLFASVTKPCPFFAYHTTVVYANDAAGSLNFTHSPTHAEQMSDEELQKKIEGDTKKLHRKQRKAISQNSNFTALGNTDFDALFNATDRNDETQFRLMFTPLAQKNMLALMRDPEGYGDNFSFIKKGELNYILPEHAAVWDMSDDKDKYRSFDVDKARQNFMNFVTQYFKSLYFSLAPALSIPLYLQTPPSQYNYQSGYVRNYSNAEAEYAVNSLGEYAFMPAGCATPSILKAHFVAKENDTDVLEVTAHSFRGADRVDLIPRLGGDGLMHTVPVHWIEYIPVQNTTTVRLKKLGLSQRQFEQSDSLHSALDGTQHNYSRGMLLAITNDEGFDARISACIAPTKVDNTNSNVCN